MRSTEISFTERKNNQKSSTEYTYPTDREEKQD